MEEHDLTDEFQNFIVPKHLIQQQITDVPMFPYLQQVVSNKQIITNEWYRSHSWQPRVS